FLTNDCELMKAPADMGSLVPGLYAPKVYRRKIPVVDSIGGVFYPYLRRLEHIRTAERAVIELAASKRRQFWYKYFYIPGTAFLAHKIAYEKVGGFDESLHTYWEDVDLSVRAIRAGVHLG